MSDANVAAGGFAEAIAAGIGAPLKGVRAVLSLLDDGGTVPFIARYRKEATGLLDEVVISNIRDLRETPG